ncbi:MAG: hypothetical protein V1735_02255 [Nanoarchaeota archaeon]
MEESLLTKAALACAVIGIVALFIVSETISYPSYSEGDGKVSFEGTVKAVEASAKVLRIVLLDDGKREVRIVAFDAPSLNLSEGARINGIGEKTTFRGKTELVAYRIVTAD